MAEPRERADAEQAIENALRQLECHGPISSRLADEARAALRNQGDQTNNNTELLCGHWTFFRLGGDPNAVARCDLPQGHKGTHKHWWSPQTHESFSWADSFERHQPRPAAEEPRDK